MKTKLLLLVALLCISSSVDAQDEISIGMVFPDKDETLDQQSYKLLQSKLQQLMSNNGVDASDQSDFLIYPVVNVVSDELVEGGMQTLHRYDIELTFNVLQYSTRAMFGSTTWSLHGDGFSVSKAFMNAVSSISRNDPRFERFISDVKQKIVNYYIGQRDALIRKAETLAAQGQYEEAIAVLTPYPSGIAGSNEIDSHITGIFVRYQKANCTQSLQRARAAFAARDYDKALALVADLDATSSCASQAKQLTEQIRRQVNSDHQAELKRQERWEQQAASLEKERIRAARDVAKAYYQRTYPPVTYHMIYHYR